MLKELLKKLAALAMWQKTVIAVTAVLVVSGGIWYGTSLNTATPVVIEQINEQEQPEEETLQEQAETPQDDSEADEETDEKMIPLHR